MTPETDPEGNHDTFEIVATVLLGLGAVLIAVATYQAALWGGIQDTAFAESVRETSRAADETQKADTDRATDEAFFVELVLRWTDSPEQDLGVFLEEDVGAFILGNMTLEGAAAAEEWFYDDTELSAYPFDDDYWALFYAESEAATQASLAEFEKATAANEKGDEFEFAVTFFTLVLFLAGVSVVVQNDRLRLALIVIAGLVLVGSGIYLGTLDWTS